MNKTEEAIINECVKVTRELLDTDWDEIQSMREEEEGRIKITVAYLIQYKGNEQSIKTSLSYGRRVTDSRESVINPNQLDMFDGEPPESAESPAGASGNGEQGDDTSPAKKRGVRARKAAGKAS